MAKKQLDWLKRFFQKRYRYQFVEDIPDAIQPRIIYIIQNNGYAWQLVILCPCGCRKNLHMNLTEEYKPSWKFKVDKRKRISIYPSIHRMVGCKSHFFIKKGKIIWV